MGNIHFSKETFNKLKENPYDKNTAILLSKFNPDRPTAASAVSPKKVEITDNNKRTHRKPNKKRFKKAGTYQEPGIRIGNTLPNEPKIFSILPFTKEQKKLWFKSSKSGRKSIEHNIAENEKLKRSREISARLKPSMPVAFGAVGIGVNTSKATGRKSQSNRRRTSSQNVDQYDLAGQDIVRNVEYGHGRRKSDEWNDEAAYDFNRELHYLKRKRIDDPNEFDRQAMK